MGGMKDGDQMAMKEDAGQQNKDGRWRMEGGEVLTKTHEEVCDIDHVRRVPSSIVIHFVPLPGLVLNDVQKDVDSRLAVLGSGAVPAPEGSVKEARVVKGRGAWCTGMRDVSVSGRAECLGGGCLTGRGP